MLPDVRFVGTQPNADLIRHADMVWIQPNCIGHGDFYKLINIVRTHHIPIYYFSCASAAKCADELVKMDTEGLER